MPDDKESIELGSGAGTLKGPYLHHGICEPSDTVLIGGTEHGTVMLVVDDEDNFLRVYVAEADGPPLSVPVPDLYDFLKLDRDDPDQKADFEGLARLGDRIYVIGSHSRNRNGKVRKSRHQFFALTAPPPGGTRIGVVPGTVSKSLMSALRASGLGLAASIGSEQGKQEDLAPEKKGLNIEGLAVALDGNSLLIGLRNPLSAENKARVLRLHDPAGVVAGTSDPNIEPYADLNLAKRGIRCMVWLEDHKSYLLIAGPNDSEGSFALYRWSGRVDEAPVVMVDFEGEPGLPKDFRPEAVALDTDGKRLHLLSDDGDRIIDGLTPPTKTLKDVVPQSKRFFRSWVFTPTQF